MSTNYKLLVILMVVFACSSEPQGEFYLKDDVAIEGYDPVSYFIQSEPLKGTSELKSEYNGIVYQFSSQENMNLFQETPDKYLPKYGGWCAYAVAESATKMAPDPTNWQIQNGELQLFVENWQTKIMGSLKDEWNGAPEEFKSKADTNWEKMN